MYAFEFVFRSNSDYFYNSSSFAFSYSARTVSSCSFKYSSRNSLNVCFITTPHFLFYNSDGIWTRTFRHLVQVLFLLSYRVTIEIAGFEPTHQGVKVLCLTTWLYLINLTQTSWCPGHCPARIVCLCRLVSPYGWYIKGSWRKVESNHRHTGLQPAALPNWAIAPK